MARTFDEWKHDLSVIEFLRCEVCDRYPCRTLQGKFKDKTYLHICYQCAVEIEPNLQIRGWYGPMSQEDIEVNFGPPRPKFLGTWDVDARL